MLQRFSGGGSGTITAADTNAHLLPAETCGVLYLQAGSGNTGTVTIAMSPNIATTGTAGNGAGGIVLAAGQTFTLGPILATVPVQYQFSVGSADTLNYFYIA